MRKVGRGVANPGRRTWAGRYPTSCAQESCTGIIRATASITTIEAVNARRSTRFRRPLENFSGQVRSGHLLRSNGKARSPSAEQGSGRAGLGVEFVFQGPRGRKAKLPRCLDRSEEHTSELQSLMRISYA